MSEINCAHTDKISHRGLRGHRSITHAHGRSMETQTPLATSGFFRRPRTIRVTLAYFYLELNCMESLLKKAVKSAEICERRNLVDVA